MKKTETNNAAALRSTADARIATWRALAAEATAKREAASEFARTYPTLIDPGTRQVPSTPSFLKETQLNLAALEAEHAAGIAEHTAVSALDAAEVAEGDELALARDPKRFHDDLAALDAEERALHEKIADVDRRRIERRERAFSAEGQSASRRNAAELPKSAPLPRPPVPLAVGVVPYLTTLAERAEKGTPAPSRTSQIEACRGDIKRIAADLEEARLAKEALAKKTADRNAAKEWEEEQQRQRAHAKDAASAAEAAEARAKRERLATDYLARMGV